MSRPPKVGRTDWSQSKEVKVMVQPLAVQLDMLESVVANITATAPDEASPIGAAAASRRVRAVMDRLVVQRWGWLSTVENAGLWGVEQQTARTFPRWLMTAEGIGARQAHQDVRVARALADGLGATSADGREGLVSAEHVRLMATVAATSTARREALAAPVGEQADAGLERPDGRGPRLERRGSHSDIVPATDGQDLLLGYARACTVGTFTTLVKRFAHVADPMADERGFRKAQEREFFDVSPTMDGYHLAGFLTPENGQAVKTALRAIISVPKADDGLLPAQRRAVALGGMARIVLDQGLVGSGAAVRPHLSVVTSWSELKEAASATGASSSRSSEVSGTPGPSRTHETASRQRARGSQAHVMQTAGVLPKAAQERDVERMSWNLVTGVGPAHWEDGTGPIPRSVLARIAADCQLTRVVFGPDSEILDVGRSQRTFTGARRRAVIARDRRCVWPGCEAPPEIGEVHHAVKHWAAGGETSTDNAALLCFFHHRHVDSHHITMRFDNGWRFGDPP